MKTNGSYGVFFVICCCLFGVYLTICLLDETKIKEGLGCRVCGRRVCRDYNDEEKRMNALSTPGVFNSFKLLSPNRVSLQDLISTFCPVENLCVK